MKAIRLLVVIATICLSSALFACSSSTTDQIAGIWQEELHDGEERRDDSLMFYFFDEDGTVYSDWWFYGEELTGLSNSGTWSKGSDGIKIETDALNVVANIDENDIMTMRGTNKHTAKETEIILVKITPEHYRQLTQQ